LFNFMRIFRIEPTSTPSEPACIDLPTLQNIGRSDLFTGKPPS